ncbi:MAG: hypothetical protein ACXWC9_07665 [Pseudobdellovibrionaceae bacterium]
MKSLLFVLVTGLLVLSQAQAVNYSATLFEQKSNKEKKLYTFQVEDTNPDAGEFQTTFKDMDGNVVVQEKAVVKGSDIVKFEIDHKQLAQKGLIEVKDGKAYFTKIMADGKSSTKEEKLGKTFVVSATFQKFVRDNWEAITGGKEIEFRYGVWDRQETVGFEVFKTGEDKVGEQPVVVLKMKPSNFFISKLVDPIIFKFAADGSKLLEMNGRVPPKRKDGNNWKDLDAEVVYTY